MNRAARIQAAIEDAYAPDMIEVTDESHLHAGHAGAQPGGETHY
ncbi:MAG: BolA/IbaG family iron-sulfur metabolism protein, partial [Alphaproteobacteria bacterium]